MTPKWWTAYTSANMYWALLHLRFQNIIELWLQVFSFFFSLKIASIKRASPRYVLPHSLLNNSHRDRNTNCVGDKSSGLIEENLGKIHFFLGRLLNSREILTNINKNISSNSFRLWTASYEFFCFIDRVRLVFKWWRFVVRCALLRIGRFKTCYNSQCEMTTVR